MYYYFDNINTISRLSRLLGIPWEGDIGKMGEIFLRIIFSKKLIIVLFSFYFLTLSFSEIVHSKELATIVIDPGHPSETSAGTKAADGTLENDVNWEIAIALQQRLSTVPGLRVLLTKDHRRQYISNRHRAELANAASALLFLRLHCDSGRKRGFTFYYPNRPGTTTAGNTGPSPKICRHSASAAIILHREMRCSASNHFYDNGILPESKTYVGSRQGALTGSIFSEVPVVTVEMFYMSSPEDMATYRSTSGRDALLAGLENGILAFLRERSQQAQLPGRHTE